MARVLITNNTLAQRAGTELYVRDLAIGLLSRGHSPIAYSTSLGEVAREIEAAGVAVTSSLDSVESPPDVIHGQHHIETMTALLRFPGAPCVFFCHGAVPWQEAPPRFPRIVRYVAVDEPCFDRLVREHSIPRDRVRMIHNFVDLDRFKQRGALPSKPKRALVLSNNVNEHSALFAALREACDRAGLMFDVVGSMAGNASPHPETILGSYDIVFAKARSALEALAVGCAVILSDETGTGPMVTTDNLGRLRPLNFGFRALSGPLDAGALYEEIARYDPSNAAEVSRFVRTNAGLDGALNQIEALYEEVIREHKTRGDGDIKLEGEAASEYVRYLGSLAKERDRIKGELHGVQSAYERVSVEARSRMAELNGMKATLGWRVLSWYGPIKHRFIRPMREKLRSLIHG